MQVVALLAILKQNLFAQVNRFKYNRVRSIVMVTIQHPVEQHGVHGQLKLFIKIALVQLTLVLRAIVSHLLLVVLLLALAVLVVLENHFFRAVLFALHQQHTLAVV